MADIILRINNSVLGLFRDVYARGYEDLDADELTALGVRNKNEYAELMLEKHISRPIRNQMKEDAIKALPDVVVDIIVNPKG